MLSTWPQAQPLPIPSAEPYVWVTSLVLKASEFGLHLQLVQAPHLSAEETAAHGGGHSAGRCRTRTIIQSAESQASISSIHTNVWKILTEGAGTQDVQLLLEHATLGGPGGTVSCSLVYHWSKSIITVGYDNFTGNQWVILVGRERRWYLEINTSK